MCAGVLQGSPLPLSEATLDPGISYYCSRQFALSVFHRLGSVNATLSPAIIGRPSAARFLSALPGRPQCRPGREIRDHCGSERTCGQEIQPRLETLRAVLDPADDERADIAAEVADGIDQRNSGGGGRPGEEH